MPTGIKVCVDKLIVQKLHANNFEKNLIVKVSDKMRSAVNFTLVKTILANMEKMEEINMISGA